MTAGGKEDGTLPDMARKDSKPLASAEWRSCKQ